MQKLLFCFFSFIICLGASAQKPRHSAGSRSNEDFTGSTAIKFNPAGLFFGNISLQGEINLKPKKSFTLGVGIPMETTNRWVTIDGERKDIKIKSFSVMAGYRLYMGKKPMSGFYFEPYLHYTKNDASTNLNGDLAGDPVVFHTTSKYSAFGLGAQLGVQFLISDRVTIDLFFIGPEANSTRHNLIMKEVTTALPWDIVDAQEAEREIKDVVDQLAGKYPFIGKKINITVDPEEKTVSSDFKGFLPGFRGGLSIGIRF